MAHSRGQNSHPCLGRDKNSVRILHPETIIHTSPPAPIESTCSDSSRDLNSHPCLGRSNIFVRVLHQQAKIHTSPPAPIESTCSDSSRDLNSHPCLGRSNIFVRVLHQQAKIHTSPPAPIESTYSGSFSGSEFSSLPRQGQEFRSNLAPRDHNTYLPSRPYREHL